MNTSRALLLLASLALVACKSSEPEPADDVDLSSVECICGQPEAQIEGCPHPLCVSGEGNVDNPDCVCAPLKLGEGTDG